MVGSPCINAGDPNSPLDPDGTIADMGAYFYFDPSSIDESELLNTYDLMQNYPNPFNPVTTISWQLPEVGFVTLKIYDILGREVTTLVNEELAAGNHEVEFNSHSGEVRNLSSGIYFYQLKAGDYINTRKMVLIK